MMNNDRAEKRMLILQNEIKSLKSSMPIAGSLLDIYFYTKSAVASYPDGTTMQCAAKFIPDDHSLGLGFVDVYYLLEGFASSNSIFLLVHEGYYKNSDGDAQIDESYRAAGFGNYDAKVTVSVYSTVPGHIEIVMS